MNVVPAATDLITRHEALSAIEELFDRVIDAQSKGELPPQLRPAFERAEELVDGDDEEQLADALLSVAHGAVATVARIRAASTEDDGGTS